MNPFVSVMMICYNHDKFIEKAIDSILSQVTNFDFEIVIGDDFSRDNTRKILSVYNEKYGEKIKIIFQKNNVGVSKNFECTMQQCRGKYVAILEGDDYWIDNNKLQKQVDLLERDSTLSMCFHNAKVVYEGIGGTRSSHPMVINKKFEYTLTDITRDWFVATASIVYRRHLIENFPSWVHESVVVDLPLLAMLTTKGKAGYIDEEMSVYRVNTGGVTRTDKQESFLLNLVRMHSYLNEYLDYNENVNLTIKISNNYMSLSDLMINNYKCIKALFYLLKSIERRLSIKILPGKKELANSVKITLICPFMKLKNIFNNLI
ncbi:glycosyltransferase family 2 protein [Hymenobacter terrestris]|uniref:Glycosyltransferase n=1 Tax=Hymenobacter terrestris TaxID=2748310 RepID=A0ABX2Q4N7_9BACT|nr:glycosyltransferase [Hymenobacter terrestris]NVO85927.1 glycosyltransferase [Hymenobacter terrestris]